VWPPIKEFSPKSAADFFLILRHARWRLPLHQKYQGFIENKHGIEIGGPSVLFRTVLPLYPLVRDLDGVNFSTDTVWEGKIEAGRTFHYDGGRLGHQFVADATDLSEIPTGKYDFLLSSNCLEHVANPIKALAEWRRVVKTGGAMVLVLPRKESNFDRRRPVTDFEHLLDDFTSRVAEDDLTHLEEILALHDLRRDPPAGNLEHFRERSLRNFYNRTLHHHVFDAALIKRTLEYVGFDLLDTTTTFTDFFALACKSAESGISAD
jgi:SAM-dependent methyltransferase